MAIDSSLFIADLPAGEYKKGQEIELRIHTGPAVVRDGYGQPKLESMRTGLMTITSGSTVSGYFVIKNSNWVDPIINACAGMFGYTALSELSQGFQAGQSVPLQVNSTWSVVFHVTANVTTTVPNSVVAIVDVDYPAVSAVRNPMMESGIPASNVVSIDAANEAPGALATAGWITKTVDILKAGNRYLMSKISFYKEATTAVCSGFVRISGVASQSGLARIIPVAGDFTGAIKAKIVSSETFVKGPMDLSVLIVSGGPGMVIIDWVKR